MSPNPVVFRQIVARILSLERCKSVYVFLIISGWSWKCWKMRLASIDVGTAEIWPSEYCWILAEPEMLWNLLCSRRLTRRAEERVKHRLTLPACDADVRSPIQQGLPCFPNLMTFQRFAQPKNHGVLSKTALRGNVLKARTETSLWKDCQGEIERIPNSAL